MEGDDVAIIGIWPPSSLITETRRHRDRRVIISASTLLINALKAALKGVAVKRPIVAECGIGVLHRAETCDATWRGTGRLLIVRNRL